MKHKGRISAVIGAIITAVMLSAFMFAGAPTQWTNNCPAHGTPQSCGTWWAAPSSGQAPGFLAGQKSDSGLIFVQQNPWTGDAGAQKITAQTYQHWQLTAAAKDPSNSPGEVLSYPSTTFNYYKLNAPADYDLSRLSDITSYYNEAMPPKTGYQAHAAYDIWLNNWDTEVMVWNDLAGQGRDRSVDGDVKAGHYVFHDQGWTLWYNSNGTDKTKWYYAWVADKDTTKGTVYLKQMFDVMVKSAFIPAASPITQIGYGWEISDTGGKPLKFAIGNLVVNLKR